MDAPLDRRHFLRTAGGGILLIAADAGLTTRRLFAAEPVARSGAQAPALPEVDLWSAFPVENERVIGPFEAARDDTEIASWRRAKVSRIGTLSLRLEDDDVVGQAGADKVPGRRCEAPPPSLSQLGTWLQLCHPGLLERPFDLVFTEGRLEEGDLSGSLGALGWQSTASGFVGHYCVRRGWCSTVPWGDHVVLWGIGYEVVLRTTDRKAFAQLGRLASWAANLEARSAQSLVECAVSGTGLESVAGQEWSLVDKGVHPATTANLEVMARTLAAVDRAVTIKASQQSADAKRARGQLDVLPTATASDVDDFALACGMGYALDRVVAGVPHSELLLTAAGAVQRDGVSQAYLDVSGLVDLEAGSRPSPTLAQRLLAGSDVSESHADLDELTALAFAEARRGGRVVFSPGSGSLTVKGSSLPDVPASPSFIATRDALLKAGFSNVFGSTIQANRLNLLLNRSRGVRCDLLPGGPERLYGRRLTLGYVVSVRVELDQLTGREFASLFLVAQSAARVKSVATISARYHGYVPEAEPISLSQTKSLFGESELAELQSKMTSYEEHARNAIFRPALLEHIGPFAHYRPDHYIAAYATYCAIRCVCGSYRSGVKALGRADALAEIETRFAMAPDRVKNLVCRSVRTVYEQIAHQLTDTTAAPKDNCVKAATPLLRGLALSH